jgi:hypothetical protein
MPKLRHAGRLLRDLVQFARENKAYWIVPVTFILGLTALFIVASYGVAPFIYTLF